ncbi:MAG: gfo/Idh/MocA family oxidoreductase, partial [Betaproteobacteria bacterium]|nr:gfo/Idh/MocA family oxidoreductase [Betaproteobacteria bacterium]
ISLIKKADKLDIPVLVGHHRRHNSIIQKAKEILDKGSIGEIRSVQTTSWFYKPNEYFNIAPWRKKIGAGPVSVNLVHDVDLLRYFCGEVKSVTAHAIKSRRGYENEDLASAILTFKNDIIATISVSDSIASPWSWEMTSKEYPVYHHVDASCYLIGGSDGSLSIPDLSLWKHESKPDWWSPMTVNPISIEKTDPLVSQIHNFVQVIKGKSSPLVSGLEGLKSLQVIECIQQSIETFKSITIQDL